MADLAEITNEKMFSWLEKYGLRQTLEILLEWGFSKDEIVDDVIRRCGSNVETK